MEQKQKKEKKMIALELPIETYDILKELEAEYGGIGISGIVRLIIKDYIKRNISKRKERK